jgi:hypothetical protein
VRRWAPNGLAAPRGSQIYPDPGKGLPIHPGAIESTTVGWHCNSLRSEPRQTRILTLPNRPPGWDDAVSGDARLSQKRSVMAFR